MASFTAVTTRAPSEVLGGLNAWLPPDIRVREVTEAPPGFHARHSALRRRYRYLMRLEPTALDRERCWVLPRVVSLPRMRSAARALTGEHDFSRFTVGASDSGDARAIVYGAGFRRRGPVVQFDIEANRFLRKMVRAIVGALVEVGSGRLEADFIFRALQPEETLPAFTVAPAHGLYLVSVEYEDGLSRPQE